MGPFGVGKNLDIDLGQAKVLASVRIYAQCCTKESYDDIFNMSYANLLPNEVTVYGSNDGEKWTQIGHHYESADAGSRQWYSTYGLVNRFNPLSYDDLSQIPTPVYLDVTFSISDNSYRYVRVVPNSVFIDNPYMPNRQQYVTMQELEVYTKK